MVISDYNLQKFYTLSKQIIVNEQDSQSLYQDLSQSEFAEFVFRISSHIYEEKNYQDDQGKLNSNVPQDIKSMFDESATTKFKTVL